jgi:predicted membrane-bound dolichyl-phosphate-mannose-protein mannosyltransferase
MLKRKDFLLILAALLFFYLILYFKNPSIFTYKFDKKLIDRYMHSQDIYERIEGRVFISDSDIYIATGYLYAIGKDPTTFNFQHPPLVKYLFGLSAKYFGNPFYIQLLFAALVIFLTYILGIKVFNRRVSVLAIMFLAIDPVFIRSTANAFLDLGQTAFSLLYLIFFLFFPSNWLLQGISLGLFLSSKFWSTALFFMLFLFGYKKFVLKDKFMLNTIIRSFLVGSVVFSFIYIVSFVKRSGLFNLPFFQLKMLKFMLQHNSADVVGGSLVLFLTGYFSSWWRGGEVLRSEVWSFLWSVGFVTVLYGLKKNYQKISILLLYFPIFI